MYLSGAFLSQFFVFDTMKRIAVIAVSCNGSGLNEVCLAQLFKFATTLHTHISFKPLLWDVFLKISGATKIK